MASYHPRLQPQARRSLLFLFLVAVSAIFSGCATITRGTTEQMKIESAPPGASVRLDTGQTGITPVTFTIPRKRDVIVTVSKEGYAPVTQTITTKITGRGAAGMAGNVLIGGVIGVGVDAVSGAMLNHTPNPLIVDLAPAIIPIPLAGTTAPVPAVATDSPPSAPVVTSTSASVRPEKS